MREESDLMMDDYHASQLKAHNNKTNNLAMAGLHGRGADYWNSLSWKPVDTSNHDFGNFEDAVFFGLEEVNASVYLGNNSSSKKSKGAKKRKADETEVGATELAEEVVEEEQPKKLKAKKDKKPKKKKLRAAVVTVSETNLYENNEVVQEEAIALGDSLEMLQWGTVSLFQPIVEALNSKGFEQPTPIQLSAIPKILQGSCDIIGVAETGSGKTLAFTIPLLQTLLQSWDQYVSNDALFAMVISPTRELAMQTSKVFKEIQLSETAKIQVVTLVGGMSEQKQRRQLQQGVHVVVATPGRLNETLAETEETLVSHSDDENRRIRCLEDLSQLRYIVIDEADRMMEEGHFSELRAVLDRVLDHEGLASKAEDNGTNIRDELKKRRMGTMEAEGDEYNDGQEGDEGDLDNLDYDEFQQHQQQQQQQANDEQQEGPPPRKRQRGGVQPQHVHSARQTLLFTATGLIPSSTAVTKEARRHKLNGSLTGMRSGLALPMALRQILSVAGRQKSILLVDCCTPKVNPGNSSNGSVVHVSNSSNQQQQEHILGNGVLPATLSLFERRVISDDKDSILATILTTGSWRRVIVFVNSILAAKRLGGLLKALCIPAVALHGDLPMRARLAAVDNMLGSSTEAGVFALVCTDVAARGLDLPQVGLVIHYDIPRTPQVFIHRSGRTARIGAEGACVSLVSPGDMPFHVAILKHLNSNQDKFPQLPLSRQAVEAVQGKVTLAQRIFSIAGALSRVGRLTGWISGMVEDIEEENQDEYATEEQGGMTKQEIKSKKAELAVLRKQLQAMLAGKLSSLELDAGEAVIGKKRKNNKHTNSKGGYDQGQQDWKKRKSGFFVYNPQTM